MSFSRLYRVEAIVLKRRNIGEADRLVTLFSKERGKVTAMAKGIRRITSKRAPHLEVFSRIVLMIHKGKRFDTITEVAPLDTFSTLRKYLPRVSVAYVLCELIDVLLPEHQEHRDVYQQIFDALLSLDTSHPSKTFLADFSRDLLMSLGFLSFSKVLTEDGLIAYIEQLTERRLKTKRLLHQLE